MPIKRINTTSHLLFQTSQVLSVVLSSGHYSLAVAQNKNKQLEDITISASAFDETTENSIVPNQVLHSNTLQAKMANTIGGILENELGVASSGHGPNAQRPIIRGLDNDRVRILSNGNAIFDASATSQDHTVAINPIFAERIEILRGANALRYGGNAIGGVVNLVDDRTPVNVALGQHGEVRLSGRYGSAEDLAAGHFAFGHNNYAISVDAFNLHSGNIKVPGPFFTENGAARNENPQSPTAGRLPNSSARSDGGSIGAALRGHWGYAGISLQSLNNNYGIGNPASAENPRIDLEQTRQEFKGRLNTQGIFEAIEVNASHSHYRHSEIVDATPELTFRNQGQEARIEGLVRAIGNTRTKIGVHRSDFSLRAFDNTGTNSFLPNTRSSGNALYATTNKDLKWAQLNMGLRHEQHNVRGDNSNTCGQDAQRQYHLNSANAGMRLPINTQHALSLQFNHTERAPTYLELFACGRHEATFNAQYGNAQLPKESANGVDLSWGYQNSAWTTRTTAWQQRFNNFVTLRRGTDNLLNNEVGNLPGTAELPSFYYNATKATLQGIEFSATHLLTAQWFGLSNDFKPQLEFKFDHVRGTDENTGQALPRITPQRITLAASIQNNKAYVRLQWVHHAAQNRVAVLESETATPAYDRVDAYAAWRPQWELATRTEFFVQARNLLNAQGRNHVSFLKDFVPIQGRTISAGIRLFF